MVKTSIERVTDSFFTECPLEGLHNTLKGLVIPSGLFHTGLVFLILAHVVPLFPLIHFFSGLL